jgi:tetratricopeptide (TPR) repeat protein
MTFARNQIWGDSLLLWQDTAGKAPRSGNVLAGLANEYLKRNQPEKALPLFVRGNEMNMNLSFRPKLGIGLSLKALNVDGARFTTGEEYILQGGTLNAGAFDFKNSTKWNGVFHNNLGLAYEYLMEPEKAMKAYKTAVTLNPEYDLAWYNLALLASRRGDTTLATEAVKRLTLLNPTLAKVAEPSTRR